jgi:hypothetical protein
MTLFSNIQALTEQDMAAILFGIFKNVHVSQEDDFYEPRDQKHFWVHKMDEENQYQEALVCRNFLILVCTNL